MLATQLTFSFLQSKRPSGNMGGGTKDFSGAHKHSGYRVEPSVLQIGICIGSTEHYTGLVPTLKIFGQTTIPTTRNQKNCKRTGNIGWKIATKDVGRSTGYFG